MAETRFLDDDIVKVYEAGKPRKRENLLATLFWGDSVEVVGQEADGDHLVEMRRRVWNEEKERYQTDTRQGVLPRRARFRDEPLLKVRFVDVGQGDGAIVETPGGRILLVDGGEEEHFRRYINVAYSHLLKDGPLHLDAILVTHGDADHFAGLTKLVEGFRSRDPETPLVTASRVFHNGLVKASADDDRDAFGATEEENGVLFAVDLADDLLQVPDEAMNRPFRDWKKALRRLRDHNPGMVISRLQYGDDEAFDFLAAEGVEVMVLGPLVEEVDGRPALRFLHTPGGSSVSASHTVNGHSVVLKLTYGHVRFLFGADLNEESEEGLLQRARAENVSLASEVLKVPHHGSADFSPRILEAIRPVVSVVSSGDENTAKEYIHPRAGLIGALGKYSRASVEKPLIYVTEMVAFFRRLGTIEARRVADGEPTDLGRIPRAYQKSAHGIVHVRTDGERVLVATHSGKDDQKESYAFRVDSLGEVTFEEKPRIL